MNVNSVTISGRIGREAELRYTPSGAAVANFSVAVQGYRKDAPQDNQPTHWVDVTCWHKMAELVANRVPKGARVTVHGRLEQQTWTDRESGSKRSKLIVVADTIDIFDWKDTGQAGEYAARRPPAQRSDGNDVANSQDNHPVDDGLDDIPF